MDKLEHSINRGKEAQRLLSDPVLAEAFDAMRAECISSWETTSAEDKDGRERQFTQLMALRDLQARLRSFLTDGKIAEGRLKRQIL